MRILNAKYETDLAVTDDTVELRGMVVGQVDVNSGGLLQLLGMVVGTLVVHPGGAAIIRGTVNGNVQNLGGAVEVFGMINGELDHKSGRVTFAKDAMVNGVQVPENRTVGLEIVDR